MHNVHVQLRCTNVLSCTDDLRTNVQVLSCTEELLGKNMYCQAETS